MRLMIEIGVMLATTLAFAEAPVIEYTAATSVEEGSDFALRATILAAGGVLDARAFWRSAGATKYEQLVLVKTGEQYAAAVKVPAGAVAIEYFLVATEAKTLAEVLWKSREAPQRVEVTRRPVSQAIPVVSSVPGPSPIAAAQPPPPAPPTLQVKPAGKPKLIVMEPQGESISEAAIRALDDMVLTELSRQDRFEVLGSSDVKRMLGAVETQQKVGCDANVDSCLAEIGGAVGAQYLATTTLAKFGSQYLVNFKLIDVLHAKVIERRGERVPATDDDLLTAIQRIVSSLEVRPKPSAAPASPPMGAAGTSSVPMAAAGTSSVPIAATGTSSLPMVAAGTSVAAGIAYGVLFMLANSAADVGDLPATQTRALGANVAGGVAITAGVAAIGLYFMGNSGVGAGGDSAPGR